MKSETVTVYKDLETGIVHYAKHKADGLHLGGHRIRVYSQNRRTLKMIPVIEWIPGSWDYYSYSFGQRRRVSCRF